MRGLVLLVRHCEVDPRYAGMCYGQTDLELSEAGRTQSEELAGKLTSLVGARGVTLDHVQVVHSGLQRTRWLADSVAARLGLVAQADSRLRERDFGAWELKQWDDIHRESGDAMLRMLTLPATFRPGGGETTTELQDRVLAWFSGLGPRDTTVAITHGGPIAALCGTLEGLPVPEWPSRIPKCGESVILQVPVALAVR